MNKILGLSLWLALLGCSSVKLAKVPRSIDEGPLTRGEKEKVKSVLSRLNRKNLWPQKNTKNAEKLIFSTKFSEIFRTCPNASERIQMHPNVSECIRAHPNRSEQVRKARKTFENVEQFAKNSRKFHESFRDRLFRS